MVSDPDSTKTWDRAESPASSMTGYAPQG